MTRIRSASLMGLGLAGLVVWATPAEAYRHTNRLYVPEDFPVEFRVADDAAVPSSPEICEGNGGFSGCCEETVPPGYCYEAAAQGFQSWMDVPCTDIDVEVPDGTADPAFVAQNVFDLNDGVNAIIFNNGNQERAAIGEVGTLAVTYSRQALNQIAAIIDGDTYFGTFEDVDIVFNEGVRFISDPEFETSGCSGQFNMQSVMTHEIGHALGMGHSCEENEPCPDPTLATATMFWSEGPCQRVAVDLNQDDIDGITKLYGPSASFACSSVTGENFDQVVGVVPLELECVVFSDNLTEIVSTEWFFGDGGSSTDLNPTHTYTEPGNYTIQLTVDGESLACGDDGWRSRTREIQYVRACGEPEPEFEIHKVDGLRYRLANESDISVYGCVSDIQWDVFEGAEATGEPLFRFSGWEPVIDIPRAGTYTVAMSLGGIGGTGGAIATFEASGNAEFEAFACNAAMTPIGFGGAGLLLGGLLIRRRRRS